MEIEKVIRILAVTLVVAAFAVKVAARLMFPEADASSDGIIAVVLLLCLGSLWCQPAKEKHSNK